MPFGNGPFACWTLRGPARRFDVVDAHLVAHSRVKPLFTEPAPMSGPVAKGARAVALRALPLSQKPTP